MILEINDFCGRNIDHARYNVTIYNRYVFSNQQNDYYVYKIKQVC